MTLRQDHNVGMSASAVYDFWLSAFARCLGSGSQSDLAGLLTADATWRDFMAFPWDFSHTIGRAQTAAGLVEQACTWGARNFVPSTEQLPVLLDGDLYCFFGFTTEARHDRGFVQLTQVDGEWLACVIQTQVEGLLDHPELSGANRPHGKVHGEVLNRTCWRDDRARQAAFDDEEPTVVVLGAGHNGLSVAARLGALGVSTLVFEKEERVGDTWRKRYRSLALHSPVEGDNLPFIPLPSTWTSHTPKDKLADFLESYAVLMDLNVWTSTSLVDASYDAEDGRWRIQVRRGDGSVRLLRPRHFVVAGGLFGSPKIPDIRGLSSFQGLWSHSDSFQDSVQYAGKRALVVGAGVSGHELAHDLYEHGADVTMLQRSSTWVITFDANNRFWNHLVTENPVFPKKFTDQVAFSRPNEISDVVGRELVKRAAEYDRQLIDDLERVGFQIKRGPDVTGIPGAHMAGKDAYQLDIGASRLVADGKIKLKQGVEIAEIVGSTVRFTDGSEMPDVDLIIFATGYHQFWGHIKPALGEIAKSIDKVYGRAADGEYAGTWRRSPQPGLWFATGFVRMADFYSRYTALLIKAIEEGIEPRDPAARRESGSGATDPTVG